MFVHLVAMFHMSVSYVPHLLVRFVLILYVLTFTFYRYFTGETFDIVPGVSAFVVYSAIAEGTYYLSHRPKAYLFHEIKIKQH